jgi:hypothetical protein
MITQKVPVAADKYSPKGLARQIFVAKRNGDSYFTQDRLD